MHTRIRRTKEMLLFLVRVDFLVLIGYAFFFEAYPASLDERTELRSESRPGRTVDQIPLPSPRRRSALVALCVRRLLQPLGRLRGGKSARLGWAWMVEMSNRCGADRDSTKSISLSSL